MDGWLDGWGKEREKERGELIIQDKREKVPGYNKCLVIAKKGEKEGGGKKRKAGREK